MLCVKPGLSDPQAGLPLLSPVWRKCPIILHEYMEQWSVLQIPSFHCMLSPLSGALAPAHTKSPYWTAVDAKEEKREREMDWMGWKKRVAEMKSLHLIIYREEWEEDAMRMEKKWMRCFRDVQQRGEGRWEETGGYKVTSCACPPSGFTYGCHGDSTSTASMWAISVRCCLNIN